MKLIFWIIVTDFSKSVQTFSEAWTTKNASKILKTQLCAVRKNKSKMPTIDEIQRENLIAMAMGTRNQKLVIKFQSKHETYFLDNC